LSTRERGDVEPPSRAPPLVPVNVGRDIERPAVGRRAKPVLRFGRVVGGTSLLTPSRCRRP
jgi:hypothetical protein